MKKKIDIKLLETILETDLFLIERPSKNNSRLLKEKFSAGLNSESVYTLEIFEALKNLKQLIRLLQFLSKCDSKNLYVCSSNKMILGFLNRIFDNHQYEDLITIQSNFTRIRSSGNSTSSLLLLDESLLGHNNVFKKLFEENILIINKINSKIELNNNCTYKIYNNILDSKKLVFFMALLRQLLSNKIK